MRIVLQRVSEASVTIDNRVEGQISQGFVLLLGITDGDSEQDIEWLIQKTLGMRIFSDEQGLMNKSLRDIGGSILLISQFTLYASTKKGKRPSFIKAARPDVAIPLYESFIKKVRKQDVLIETGIFGADMKVSLVNDGPVTIIIDSKHRE